MTLSTPLVRILIGLSTAAAAMLWNGQPPNGSNTLTTIAQARIGRPLTPMSYAGVARRTTRRAVTYGAAAERQRPQAATTMRQAAPKS